MTQNLLILFLALLLDRIAGDPAWLWQRLPHPVVLFGKAIAAMDAGFNRQRLPASMRRRYGALSIAALLAASLLVGWGLHALLGFYGPLGIFVEVILVAILLAQKSLSDHVGAVAGALRRDGLAGGRRAVALIVGRDPDTLDGPGVCRAAIESLAENFADGVVAPALWYALLGLPGLFAYKMLNTADSMIGHKSEKYLDFGRASARLDDLANWPAARLSLFLVAAGALARFGRAAARNAVHLGLRDSGLHRSPNSGWPEAAMAGALDIQLAGPRVYGGNRVSEAMINAAGRDATVEDIEAGLDVFAGACSALTLLVLLLLLAASLLA